MNDSQRGGGFAKTAQRRIVISPSDQRMTTSANACNGNLASIIASFTEISVFGTVSGFPFVEELEESEDDRNFRVT